MLIKDIPKIMGICLLLTITVEIIFAYILRVRDKKDYVNIILVNIVTNPIVVSIPIYINYQFGVIYYYISLVILEVLAVITEGLIYKNSTTKGSQWKGLITSLVFPGIGLIDLRDSNMGPLHEGILPGNKVTKQNIPDNENGYLYECFIPQEYIKNGENPPNKKYK